MYTAPEVVLKTGHSKEVDWWALGILLYELVVGIPPFYSKNDDEMFNKIKHGVLRFPAFLDIDTKDIICRVRRYLFCHWRRNKCALFLLLDVGLPFIVITVTEPQP